MRNTNLENYESILYKFRIQFIILLEIICVHHVKNNMEFHKKIKKLKHQILYKE